MIILGAPFKSEYLGPMPSGISKNTNCRFLERPSTLRIRVPYLGRVYYGKSSAAPIEVFVSHPCPWLYQKHGQ